MFELPKKISYHFCFQVPNTSRMTVKQSEEEKQEVNQ